MKIIWVILRSDLLAASMLTSSWLLAADLCMRFRFLKSHGLPQEALHIVASTIIVSRMLHAVPHLQNLTVGGTADRERERERKI